MWKKARLACVVIGAIAAMIGIGFLTSCLNRQQEPTPLAGASNCEWLYKKRIEAEDVASKYNDIVLNWLQDDLWSARDMYDATHNLMVPMYYAFWACDEELINGFSEFFTRFTNDVFGEDRLNYQSAISLGHLHFDYLCTQYMNLCAANDMTDLIPERLGELPRRHAEEYLLNSQALWGTEATVTEHIRQIIAGKQYSYRYYSSFEDPERFALAILCDLKCFNSINGKNVEEVLTLAADLAYQLFSAEHLNQETDCGGWLFQVGVNADSPDFSYAGNEEIYLDMTPKIKADVAEDSSHAHRWPLLLRSYQSAQDNPQKAELFQTRREQLANQMIAEVLKNVGGYWLTTTFMDGENGVYRYSYELEGVGLDGYDLSSTFLVGWWSLLLDKRITDVYNDILENMKENPLKWDEANPYYNETAGVQNKYPHFDANVAFENGMMETLVYYASQITE